MKKCHICQKEIQEDDAVRLGWKNDPNPIFICRECAQPICGIFVAPIAEERELVNLINKQTEAIIAVPKD